jgi:hypothetical protein
MSYDLTLWSATRDIQPKELSAFFQKVEGFRFDGPAAIYENPHTGVMFVVETVEGDRELHSAAIQFLVEMPYFRASYTAREIEPILREFVTEFDLLVDDSQVGGMDTSEYSTEGFLSGWDHGNRFAHRLFLRDMTFDETNPLWHRPKADLEQLFTWNRKRPVTPLGWVNVGGALRTVAIWKLGQGEIPMAETILVMITRRSLLFKKKDFAVLTDRATALQGFRHVGATIGNESIMISDAQAEQWMDWWSKEKPESIDGILVPFESVHESEAIEDAYSHQTASAN